MAKATKKKPATAGAHNTSTNRWSVRVPPAKGGKIIGKIVRKTEDRTSRRTKKKVSTQVFEWAVGKKTGTAGTLRRATSAVANAKSTKSNPIARRTSGGTSVMTEKTKGGKVTGSWNVFLTKYGKNAKGQPSRSKGKKLGTVSRKRNTAKALRYYPSKGKHPRGFSTLHAAAMALK